MSVSATTSSGTNAALVEERPSGATTESLQSVGTSVVARSISSADNPTATASDARERHVFAEARRFARRSERRRRFRQIDDEGTA